MKPSKFTLALLFNIFAISILPVIAQETPVAQTKTALGLEDGTLSFDTPDFTLKLVKDSQTVAALLPKNADGFDFTPSDRLEKRAADGFNHLGDLTLRVRKGKAEAWRDYATSAARKPVTALPTMSASPTISALRTMSALPTVNAVLAYADLSPTLPPDIPLHITRSWLVENGKLVLRFDIKNLANQPVEIGALGIPLVFNNIISDRSLSEAHEKCAFFDPYIGQDAGYLQVTRLSGKGPALVVVPDGKTPFEAYRLLDEPVRPNQTFEGTFAWMAHSQAYAENEWAGVQQWNPPTLQVLAAGQTRSYGVKFLLSPQIRDIEETLAANKRPVAVGIPGYILPQDLNARLFLNYAPNVKALEVEPKGAIAITRNADAKNGWKSYTVRGQGWGRARLTVTYEDGTKQAISYYVTKPAAAAVSDLGHFLFTKQWFVDPNDPFGRSPSVISYDREADKQLVQETRAWIAGLGDEGGSGSWLAAAMKEFGQPNPTEVAQYEQFVNEVLWGNLQFSEGPEKWGVRKTTFYYDPKKLPDFHYDPKIDGRSWTNWNYDVSQDIGRGYNYPHVVAAYWAMYRIARNHPGLVKSHDWQWYLNQAYETTNFAFGRKANGQRNVGYVELGLMDGTVFLELLKDLKRENWDARANRVEALMRERAERWKGEEYPFGSEMAWDSTGQEEVYDWCDYFGYDDKAQVSLNSILGYMPTLPHWGYNGNARRYWDFLYGGKLSRIERQLHHYGSGLNAIPMLDAYRENPQDYYLLRVGYGGTMGALTNIDRGGFASVAFHSFPSTLKWDAYSGDYGPNFFGHAINTATYLINHPDFGWQSFGGNVSTDGDWVAVAPRDSFRQRVYLAPRGLWLNLDAGNFLQVRLNTRSGAVRVQLPAATPFTPQARLRIEQPAKIDGVGTYRPNKTFPQQNGIYEIALGKTATWIELTTAP